MKTRNCHQPKANTDLPVDEQEAEDQKQKIYMKVATNQKPVLIYL